MYVVVHVHAHVHVMSMQQGGESKIEIVSRAERETCCRPSELVGGREFVKITVKSYRVRFHKRLQISYTVKSC